MKENISFILLSSLFLLLLIKETKTSTFVIRRDGEIGVHEEGMDQNIMIIVFRDYSFDNIKIGLNCKEDFDESIFQYHEFGEDDLQDYDYETLNSYTYISGNNFKVKKEIISENNTFSYTMEKVKIKKDSKYVIIKINFLTYAYYKDYLFWREPSEKTEVYANHTPVIIFSSILFVIVLGIGFTCCYFKFCPWYKSQNLDKGYIKEPIVPSEEKKLSQEKSQPDNKEEEFDGKVEVKEEDKD